jgi:hypothetical protein
MQYISHKGDKSLQANQIRILSILHNFSQKAEYRYH